MTNYFCMSVSKTRYSVHTPNSATRIHASIISLGGVILAGLLLMLLVIFWIATHVSVRNVWLEGALLLFSLALLAYALDGATEVLELKNNTVLFDGLFTRARLINLQGVERILLVHQGLNTEWGVETLTFEYTNGSTERAALGPLWRRRELETFLARLEVYVRDHKIVEEVR